MSLDQPTKFQTDEIVPITMDGTLHKSDLFEEIQRSEHGYFKVVTANPLVLFYHFLEKEELIIASNLKSKSIINKKHHKK